MLEHLDFRAKKKAAKLKKYKLHQQLFGFLRMRRQEDARVKEMHPIKKPKAAESKDSVVWSSKVSTIRNRLDGKKRTSKERWNRFAGTSSGGARGL